MSNAPTPRQQQIIDEPGNLLVVAGPGSGKTATMVRKIARILQTPHNRVVAVTFTRDGANEMRERLARLLSPAEMKRATASTFHSLTIDHLRRHRRLDRVATPAQQRAFLARARQQFAPDMDMADLQLVFESVKCSLTPTEQIRQAQESSWFHAYEDTLRRHNLIDLYDVMRRGVELMQSGEIPSLDCTHLVVDETQDNDEIQAAWVAAHKQQIVTMVGDDDQTIYEWRRAIGFHGMLAFRDARNAKVVLLEDNFRSRAEILDAASAVIAHNNPYRNDKNLVPRRGPGGGVTLVATGSLEATCNTVRELVDADLFDLPDPAAGACFGVKTGSWAILSRTNLLLDFVESFLSEAEIKVFRSSGSLWDHPIAQTALQTLNSILTNDTIGVDIALHHAKFDPNEISAVIETNRRNIGALLDGEGDLGAAQDRKRMEALFQRTAKWRKLVGSGSFSSAVERVCEFVASHLPASKKQAAEVILRPLGQRLNRIQADPAVRVSKLLSETKKRSAQDAVCLYTMHGAKGLEFDNVVIVGCDDQVIPGDAIDLPPGSPGIGPGDSTVQSERRLFYVGMTRAKNRLWLAHSFADPSRFLKELPRGLPVIHAKAAEG